MQPHTILSCPVHFSEQIQLVCMTCPSNSLACPLCLDISHTLHEVISLKKFMSHEVSKLYDEKPKIESLSKNFDNFSLLFKHYMEKMRKQVGHELNQLQSYFEQRNDRFRQEIFFVCGDHQRKNLHQNIEAAKLMIKNKLKIPSQQVFCQKLKSIETKLSQVVQDACLEIRRIIFNLKDCHNQSSNVLINSAKFSHFQFSETLKHSSIQLRNGRNLAFNKHFDNIYHSCVVTPPLSPFHPSITLEIKKSEHKCIWLGISSLQVVTKTKLENVYKGNGPNYWIWQAGGDEEAEIYSENSENRPLVGWNFEKGDRIMLKISYQENGKKMLHIIKNENEQESYSLQINENVGSYYPCISLGDEQQSVAIVNQQF